MYLQTASDSGVRVLHFDTSKNLTVQGAALKNALGLRLFGKTCILDWSLSGGSRNVSQIIFFDALEF